MYNFSATNDSQGYKACQDYGQYFETNYWHRYSKWNQPIHQKCLPKSEQTVETPIVKSNGNLTLVGKFEFTPIFNNVTLITNWK